MTRIALRELCGYRAGDKGDTADVALFAYDDDVYALIVREVTAARVREHFGALVLGDVERYDAANVRALNFVLRGVLGAGGGASSLRTDAQAKAYGEALLRVEVSIPVTLLAATVRTTNEARYP